MPDTVSRPPSDRVLLHIGMHKTGSSAIQRALSGYDDGTVAYADFGPENHSIGLITAFHDAPETYKGHTRIGRDDAQIEELGKKWRGDLETSLSRHRATHIVSAEGACHLSVANLRTLSHLFALHAEHTHIEGYVRDAYSFANSSLQERIKGGITKFKLRKQNFRKRLNRFLTVFGKESVKMMLFNRDDFPNGSVVQDFAGRVGIDGAQLEADKPSKNASIAAEAAAVMFVFNREDRYPAGSEKLRKDRAHAVQHMKALFHRKIVLSTELVERSCDLEDIAWLKENFGVDVLAKRPSTQSVGEDSVEIGSESDLLDLGHETLRKYPDLLKDLEQLRNETA